MTATSQDDLRMGGVHLTRNWIEGLRRATQRRTYTHRVLATMVSGDGTEYAWSEDDCKRALRALDDYRPAPASGEGGLVDNPPEFSRWEDDSFNYRELKIAELRRAVEWLIERTK